MKLSFIAYLLPLALLLAACDSSEPDDPAEAAIGSFELTVSGAVSRTIDGPIAQFGAGTDPQTGVSGFGLTLGNQSQDGLSLVRKSGRPGNGMHTIAAFGMSTDDLPEDAFIGTFVTSGQVYVTDGGTLTITRSSDDVLEGSITFTAVSLIPGQSQGITVSGSFKAVGLDVAGL